VNTYQTVTDRIVAMLESGARPWAKPWVDGAPAPGGGLGRPLRVGGQPYRGVNTINLWAAAQARGFASPYWLTFKAAKQLGAYVRKGERSELAFFVGRQTRTRTDDNGQDVEDSFSFLRAYAVFNADQIEDLPVRFTADRPAPVVIDEERDATCEEFVRATGATIRHGGDRAFFAPSLDCIAMPAFSAFKSPADYYAILLHELTHWTAPEKRCDRTLGKRFGDAAYAAEELVAELGAAFLCADLGVSAEPRADHASYIASWIKVLKSDNRAIFRAAALAERAVGYLHGLQDAGEADETDPALDMAA
jgi:antirestriction protein ArdC